MFRRSRRPTKVVGGTNPLLLIRTILTVMMAAQAAVDVAAFAITEDGQSGEFADMMD